MRFKVVVLALVALCATSALASAQSQTGEIFGKVTDGTGATLPGVTVTVTSPVLLQPLMAVTSETGTFQFPRVEIGEYSVKFELVGFKTVINQGIRVTVGFSAAVNAQLGISSVQGPRYVAHRSSLPALPLKSARDRALASVSFAFSGNAVGAVPIRSRSLSAASEASVTCAKADSTSFAA